MNFYILGACLLLVCDSASAQQQWNLSIADRQYPPTPGDAIGWNPGETIGRAYHNATDGSFYFGLCPDDPNGICGDGAPSPSAEPHYQADFDIGGGANQTPCVPNSSGCPIFATWFGAPGSRMYSCAINNYPPNSSYSYTTIWTGFEENIWTSSSPSSSPSSSLAGRNLQSILLTLTLNAKLDRDLVQNGQSASGQGKINLGFAFTGADGKTYIIEMNLSNMRENLNQNISNAWRDDIWAESVSSSRTYYTIGARNWGFNLVEDKDQTILFDPWWVATTLLYPPSNCPFLLDNYGQYTGYNDIYNGGVEPCGGYAKYNRLPWSALFDSNNQPAATLISLYVGVETAGDAVHGTVNVKDWTIRLRQ